MRRLARLSKWCPGPETYYDGEPPTDTNRHGADAGSSNFVNIQRASIPCKHLPTYAYVFGCSAPLTLFTMSLCYASTCWRDLPTLPTSILARDLSVQSPEGLGKRTKQPSVRNNCSYRRWGSCGSTVLTFWDDKVRQGCGNARTLLRQESICLGSIRLSAMSSVSYSTLSVLVRQLVQHG